MPFTMEGTTVQAAGSSNGFAVAGLVLGIVGVPAAYCFLPSMLAILFGSIAYGQIRQSGVEGGGKGMAITGIIFGATGVLIGAFVHLH